MRLISFVASALVAVSLLHDPATASAGLAGPGADFREETSAQRAEFRRPHPGGRRPGGRTCACRSTHRHPLRRHAGAGGGFGLHAIPAASVGADDPYRPRPVVGRMVVPPGAAFNILQDHDAAADYLSKGGSAVPTLHLPSRRGVIDR